MAFTINSVVLVGGNLVRDSELKYMTSGSAKISFDIAMNRSYTNKTSGELVEETSYFKIVGWGKMAESLEPFLKKGQKVAIEGGLVQRRWTTDQNETRSVVEINAKSIVLMGAKKDGQAGGNGQYNGGQPDAYSKPQGSTQSPPAYQPQAQSQPEYGDKFSNDDVPF